MSVSTSRVLKNPIIRIRTIFRIALFAIMSVSITACGFHLRGNIPLSDSVKNMYLNAPEGTFKDELEDILTGSGATLSDTKSGAQVVLNVTKALSDRSVGTLDDRGKVDSYNLRLNVVYVLSNVAGEPIRASSSLTETRRYNFNPEQVVQSESEEEELLGSMEQAIALRIIRQLSTVTEDELNQPTKQN